MVAQGNVLPVLHGEMRVGSRVVSQEISTADEGDGGQVLSLIHILKISAMPDRACALKAPARPCLSD